MAGVKALRRIQVGIESTGTAGTAVAATTTLRMTGTMEDLRETTFPEEEIGLLGGSDRNYVAKYLAAITTEGEATFEQVGYILGAGVQDSTATTDTGTGYIYSYSLPTTAQRVPFTYTIEGGTGKGGRNTLCQGARAVFPNVRRCDSGVIRRCKRRSGQRAT